MTNVTDIKSWAATALKECGLSGRGSVWRLRRPEVQWVVHVDQLPFGERLGVDIGLDLQTESTPKRPTDCGILLHLENLPPARDPWIVRALDLGSDLNDDQRRADIVDALHALGEYVAARGTYDEVRRSFLRGEFESGFIRKDVREMLSSGSH